MFKVESILERAGKRAESAEVIYVESETTPITFKADRLHSLETKHASGVGLRLIRKGRLGFASTTDPKQITRLIRNATESARYGQEAKFEFPGAVQGREAGPVVACDEVRGFTAEEGVRIGEETIERIKDKEAEVKVDVSISKEVRRVRILNTRGSDVTYEKTVFSYYAIGFIILDGSFLWVYDGRTSCRPLVETEAIVSVITDRVALARKVAPVPSRRMSVIFTSEPLVSLLMALEMGTSGKRVQKRSSPLTGRIGEEILDPRVSIFDDGRLDYGVGSAPFDGEGVPTQRTALFDHGTLRAFTYDLQTAGMMGEVSTGNGGRDFSSLPVPMTTNFAMETGDTSLERMISSIAEGVLVHGVIGGGQSNLIAGDFSVNVGLGYKIEKGHLVGRVKDTMVAGNVYDILKNNLAAVGDRIETQGNYHLPALQFSDLSVVGRE
jgi:PmbA protein